MKRLHYADWNEVRITLTVKDIADVLNVCDTVGLRRMADGVAIAHDTLCGTVVHNVDNGQFAQKEDTFRRWCESMQIGKSTAYKLLQVSTMFDKSTPREQKVLEELSPSLLYATAKPSAPAELVQAVKDGDITTHKQYQAALE
ncbi:MAG: hypothetical protein ACLRI7_00005, partial [Ruthenibacterium lactatiformans]